MLAEMWQLFLNGDVMILNIFTAIGGAVLGGTFADIDLAPPLPIKHRSIWTHGPLVPMAMIWSMGQYPVLWWFTVGFLPAFALHLLNDSWPKRWHGGALIKLYPIPGTLPALLSFLWLFGSAGLSLKLLWGLVW